MINKTIKIDSTLSNQELIDSLKIKQNVDKDVVESMPRSMEKEFCIEIFTLGRYVTDSKLEEEFESRGLESIDPYSLALWYKDNPNKYDYLGSHWKGKNGKWCHIAFGLWDYGERGVSVGRYDFWGDGWWFAGVRKSTKGLDTLPCSDPLSFELPIEKLMPEEVLFNGVKYKKVK